MSPEFVPDVSVVIPIYNEERILRAAVVDLLRSLDASGWSHEIILAENGSSDDTLVIAEDLCRTHREVRLICIGAPNYGRALRQGILASQGKVVICEEIDLCDAEFHRVAVQSLIETQTDMIVGSKLLAGADDRRPLLRHVASLLYTLALRVLVGFPGTDTHGLKAFKRERLAEIAHACVIEKDVFASEFVIRAHRSGLMVRELPVGTAEKRPPSALRPHQGKQARTEREFHKPAMPPAAKRDRRRSEVPARSSTCVGLAYWLFTPCFGLSAIFTSPPEAAVVLGQLGSGKRRDQTT